jgi:hypothetical protein
MNQQTRQYRRLYVGGLPPGSTAAQLQEFLNSTLVALGLAAPGPLPPVVRCDANAKGFAFLEFHDVPDCTACLRLDGVIFNGAALNVKRPRDYVMPAGHVDPPALGPIAIAQMLAQRMGGDLAALAGGGGAAAAGPPAGAPPAGGEWQ